MKQRALSVILAICLLLGLLPTAAWAATPIADESGDYNETVEIPLGESEDDTLAENVPAVEDAAVAEGSVPTGVAELATDENLQIQVAEADLTLADEGYSVILTVSGAWDSYDW